MYLCRVAHFGPLFGRHGTAAQRALDANQFTQTADFCRVARLHLAEGLWENSDVANKVFFFFLFFKSLTVLISTDSDSALALVNRKVKT